MKPYYRDEQAGITLYHDRAENVLPSLNLDGIGVVIADPPYGVNMRRGDGRLHDSVTGDDTPFDPTLILDIGLPTVLFGANVYADKLPVSTGWLVWDKTFPDCAEQSQAELVWTNFVRGVRIHREAYHGFMRKRDGWMHPTQKPVRLMRWILCLRWTPPGGVLDPYMGSGPVIVAAKQLQRRCIGIEVEERYCEMVARRLMQEVFPWEPGLVSEANQLALLEGGQT